MPAGSSEILSSTLDIKQRMITGNKARHRLSNHVPSDVLPPSGLHLHNPCPNSSINSKLSSAGAYVHISHSNHPSIILNICSLLSSTKVWMMG